MSLQGHSLLVFTHVEMSSDLDFYPGIRKPDIDPVRASVEHEMASD